MHDVNYEPDQGVHDINYESKPDNHECNNINIPRVSIIKKNESLLLTQPQCDTDSNNGSDNKYKDSNDIPDAEKIEIPDN